MVRDHACTEAARTARTTLPIPLLIAEVPTPRRRKKMGRKIGRRWRIGGGGEGEEEGRAEEEGEEER